MSNQLKVFSYWSGELPKKALLHFTSFRRLNPLIEYTLYLESDPNYEGRICKEMENALNDLRIDIRRISSVEMFREENSFKLIFTRNMYRYRLFRKLRNLILQLILTPLGKICFQQGLRQLGEIYFHPIFGVTPGRFSYLSVSHDNLTFKSDIFRIKEINESPDVDVLYLDLDIFVNVDFRNFQRKGSFLFRWENFEFANNAAIYVSRTDVKFREYLKQYMSSKKPLQGWFIFPDVISDMYDVEIMDCSNSDPYWANCYQDYLGTKDFFIQTDFSSSNFANLIENFQLVHWHNNWRTGIEKGSLFDLCCQFVGIDSRDLH